jgi:hypothetical protein
MYHADAYKRLSMMEPHVFEAISALPALPATAKEE